MRQPNLFVQSLLFTLFMLAGAMIAAGLAIALVPDGPEMPFLLGLLALPPVAALLTGLMRGVRPPPRLGLLLLATAIFTLVSMAMLMGAVWGVRLLAAQSGQVFPPNPSDWPPSQKLVLTLTKAVAGLGLIGYWLGARMRARQIAR